MRVVLDANIYVSALINEQRAPRAILAAWEKGQVDVLVSEPILEEVGQVLRYPRITRRHRRPEADIQRFLQLLAREALLVRPTERVDRVAEDESDNRYLECAQTGKAEYIVSGDRHLLELGAYRGIAILPPAAFVVLLAE